jgi:hypothetical protein
VPVRACIDLISFWHLFENLVVLECIKSQANQGKINQLYFYRDSNGNKVELFLPFDRQWIAIEAKFSATCNSQLLESLKNHADNR